MKRLEINGQFADLSDKSIGISWQYLDVTSPGERYSPYSTNIILPYTAKNKQILGYGDVVGADMTTVRSLPSVNLWFDAYKVIDNGYLKVVSMTSAGYQCNVVGLNQVIESLMAHTFTEIFDEAVSNTSSLGTSFPGAIGNLRTGSTAGNPGWIIPVLMPDSVGGGWNLYTPSEGYKHECWMSLVGIIRSIESLGWMTLKVWESGAVMDWKDSSMHADLIKLYTPAWNYHLTVVGVNWSIIKVATGERTMSDKVIDKTTFVNFGGKTPWDFIKIVSQLFCSMIYQNGNEFMLVPLNNISSNSAIDLTGKLKSKTKYTNIPGYEKSNHITYKLTDNLKESFARTTINANVTPSSEKILYTINAMLPGFYFGGFTEGLFNTDYGNNSELSSTPVILYDSLNEYPGGLSYGDPAYVLPESKLKYLTYFDNSAWHSMLQSMSSIGICYDVELQLSLYDYYRLRPYRLLKVNDIGGLFFINSIKNYDPYSGKPAKVQLIKCDAPYVSIVHFVSISNIPNGRAGNTFSATLTYTNTGAEETKTVLYQIIHNVLGNVVSSGSFPLTFNAVGGDITITGLTYPAVGTYDLRMTIKGITEVTSNVFTTTT